MAETIIPIWTLSDRLVKARSGAGLNQTELAERLGLSLKTISRYESDPSHLGRGLLLGWAVACGVDPVWLETGDAPPSDSIAVTVRYAAAA